MKYVYLSICIILHINSFAQTIFEGKLVNKKDSEPIQNARIKIVGTNFISNSDKQGVFIFQDSIPLSFDLNVSHINYNDTIVHVILTEYQENNLMIYLSDKITQIDEITITAARHEKKLVDVTSRINLISSEDIENYPNTNFDNALQAIPNVYVNRSWGIFSKNSSVTMRGMDGTSRVLVLLDGVPLNLSAGGGINWSLIESSQIEKVEVLKGPASALYGNNAMAGVINIITKNRAKKFNAESSIFGGTYNTLGGKLSISSNLVKAQNGFYWSTNVFFRQGGGYINVPEYERDSTDVKLRIKEYNFGLSTGYLFNSKHNIEFKYQFYDDKRNEGIKIYEKDGSYLKYTTNQLQASYTGKVRNFDIYLKTFYQQQDYFQHSERLNETGDNYKLYERTQVSKDMGIWLNFVNQLTENYELSFGSDFITGTMMADDIYYTSTDEIERGGKINSLAFFVQNELKWLNNKFLLNIGFRADLSLFNNGYLIITDPTSVTSFESEKSENFKKSNWNNFSPKISIRYLINKNVKAYLSFATGFMPPKLDDLVSSRKVNKGFKIANPNLRPETLDNYEIGIDFSASDKIKLEFSGYYSIGSDFQYFAHTGDTIDIDKPVMIRENVSKVAILGFEVSLK